MTAQTCADGRHATAHELVLQGPDDGRHRPALCSCGWESIEPVPDRLHQAVWSRHVYVAGLCDCPASVRRAAPRRTWSLAEQVADIAPFIAAAARQVCPSDVAVDDVERRALERFVGPGAREHGDTLFHKSPLELLGEEVDEYSDAVVYRARRMAIAAQLRVLTVSSPLTDEEADRIREQWRTEAARGVPTLIVQPDPPVWTPCESVALRGDA
jgi:hypothetical protein